MLVADSLIYCMAIFHRHIFSAILEQPYSSYQPYLEGEMLSRNLIYLLSICPEIYPQLFQADSLLLKRELKVAIA